MAADIAGAQKKLRQAEFFLGWLEHASQDVANRYASPNHVNDLEQLDYYFSACLTATQSVFYILDKTGEAPFRAIHKQWRKNLPNDAERAKYNRMIAFRDVDVHFGDTRAIPLQKWVEDRTSGYIWQHHNAPLYGPAPVVEETNPDGETVRGRILRGTVGLYLEIDGEYVDAITACRYFIQQNRSLLSKTIATLSQ